MNIYNFYKILWFYRIKLMIDVYFDIGYYMFIEFLVFRRSGDKVRLFSF